MSTTVDSRVVEMKFDNRHFESNVSTTMSTLDKLKQRLNLTGASKGLENVGAAAKNIKLGGLGSAAETVGLKFNAMYTMADQALRNITNRVQQTAENMIKAFTIDPVKTGFQEYETQIGAIQTILANTQSKGTTLEDVNAALDELNAYADKTIYNFTEMTRNIGTFTAAGIDLNTSVTAIQGIANLAAISGSTSQQASTAMYQLSQALSSGTVKLMDWNSVVNAGMGGQVFQDALKETARVHGVAIDQMIEEQGSFRETLSEGWITSEILTETLEKFTMTTEGLTEAEIKANRERLKSIGYTDDQIEKIFELGKTSTDAATKVKTWTQLMDTLKEAAQSGWTQTWELLIGDFEQAKSLFTKISDTVGNFINKISETRNKILGGALTSKWDQLTSKIEATGITTDDFTEALKNTAKENGIAIDKIIEKHGSLGAAFAKGKLSGSLIAETLKNMVSGGNKAADSLDKLNSHTVVAGDTLWDLGKKYGTTWKEIYELNQDIIEDPHWIYPGEVLKLVENVNSLSDAQLKSKGYTEEQITALRQLAKEAGTAGTPLNDLIKDLERPSGREMLIDSLANSCKALGDIFRTIKNAWIQIFPPKTTEKKSRAIYNLISRIHALTEKFKINSQTADKLTRTFKGLFALIDIITTITGGALKLAFKALAKVFGLVDVDILEWTAHLGDGIVKVRDWIDAHNPLVKVFEFLAPKIKTAVSSIRTWIDSLKNAEDMPKAIAEGIANGFGKAFTWIINAVKNFGKSLKDGFNGVPNDVVAGLANGLWEGIKLVGEVIVELGKILISKIKEVLGIHSPSTVFMAIGGFIMAGLALGLADGATGVWDVIKGIGEKLSTMFQNLVEKIDVGGILAAALGAALLFVSNKLLNSIDSFSSPLESLGDMFDGLGDMFRGIGKNFKASALEKQSKALLNIVIAIGILALVIYAITKINASPGELWNAVGIITVLAGIMTGLMFALNKLTESTATIGKDGIKIANTQGLTVLAIAAALLIVAFAIKKIAELDIEDPDTTFKILLGAVGGMVGLAILLGVLTSNNMGANMDKAGKMLLKMSIALLVAVYVIKISAGLDDVALEKGFAVISTLSLMALALVAVAKISGEHAAKAGSMILKISIALLIIVGVIKLLGLLNEDEIKRGLTVITAFGLICVALVAVSAIAGENASKAGGMILKVSIALMILAGVFMVFRTLDDSDVERGLAIIKKFGLICVALVAVSKLAGKNAAKAGTMLLAMSVALLIVTGVLFILSQMDPKGVSNALEVVTTLMFVFGLLIGISKLAENSTGAIIALTVALAVMAGALIGLSFVDPDALNSAAIALGVVMGVFAIMVACSKNLEGSAGSLAVMIGVIAILAAALVALSMCDSTGVLKNAIGLSILMAVMAGVLWALGKMEPTIKSAFNGAVSLAIVAASLFVLVVALKMLSGVQNVVQNAIGLTILLGAMLGVLVVLGYIEPQVKKALVGLASLVILSGTLLAFVLILHLLSGVQNAMQNAIALSAMMVVMVGVVAILSKIGTSATQALLGVVAMIGLAGAMVILSQALTTMGGMSWAEIGKSLVVLAGAFLILGVAAFALSGLSPIILALGAAFLMIGTSVYLAGAGMVLLATGINALAVALSAGAVPIATGITFILTSIINLIPLLAQQIGAGIMTFCNVIIQAAPLIAMAGVALITSFIMAITLIIPQIVNLGVTLLTSLLVGIQRIAPVVIETVVVLIMSLLTAIETVIPKMVETGVKIITAFLNGIKKIVPKIVETGISVLLSLLEGIANNISKVVQTAIRIITEFIDGIAQSIPSVIQSAVDLMLAFINGMADAIEGNTDAVIAAVDRLMTAIINAIKKWFVQAVEKGRELVGKLGDGIKKAVGRAKTAISDVIKGIVEKIGTKFNDLKKAGKNIIDGFIQGIKDKIAAVGDAASEIGKKALSSIKDFLGIESPSKEFAKIGRWSDEGLANGLVKYAGTVESAAEGVGSTALGTMKNAIAKIRDAINSDMDTQPTIRPVLDLSEVEAGAGTIGNLLGSPRSVGVLRNVGVINSMMNQRSQNGTNGDVVSAIDKLNKKLDNLGGTTNNFNGITYDDGSNISEAVQTIVRAAKIERRV